jgi:hypothetical protein
MNAINKILEKSIGYVLYNLKHVIITFLGIGWTEDAGETQPVSLPANISR